MSRALTLLGLPTAELSVLFVGDARMKRLNREYRGIDKTTDVLSFPMHEGGFRAHPDLLGDIVISVPRAMRQAVEYETTLPRELRRLLMHGLLHLLGYDHEQGASRKRKMERKERELLDALAQVD